MVGDEYQGIASHSATDVVRQGNRRCNRVLRIAMICLPIRVVNRTLMADVEIRDPWMGIDKLA